MDKNKKELYNFIIHITSILSCAILLLCLFLFQFVITKEKINDSILEPLVVGLVWGIAWPAKKYLEHVKDHKGKENCDNIN